MNTFSNLIHLAELELEIFQLKFVEQIKTHVLCSVPFSENHVVYEIMSKI